MTDGEAVDVDGEAAPGGGETHLDGCGAALDGCGEDALAALGLVDEEVDVVVGVGHGDVAVGGEGDADAEGLVEGGCAEAYGGDVAALGGEEDGAVLDFGYAAFDVDGVFVDLDEVVVGGDVGCVLGVALKGDLDALLEALGELGEGLELESHVLLLGGDLAVFGDGGECCEVLLAAGDATDDLADAA